MFQVEKIWPIDKYVFSQELALEFLLKNEYNLELCIKRISENSEVFLEMLRGKIFNLQPLENKLKREEHRTNFDRFLSMSGKVSKRIHFK